MRTLGCASCIVVPIVSRDKAIGAISLVSGSRDRTYNENDLAMAVELGRRAGIAVENASLYESAQRAVQTRDEFLSIASHELKTPLTSLKLQSQIRERDIQRKNFDRFAPDNLPKLVAEDERQVNRLIRLVEDMLDVSRINTGKITFSPEEFDLCDLIRDTASRYSSQFELSKVKLELNLSSPVRGNWDRFRIEQVFLNLLMNALKYGNGKPVEVTVQALPDRAQISVRDYGMGIHPRDQTRIFEQFERAIGGHNISGLGLGLFISKRIVEAHQGWIRVESAEGEGSRFIVELPLSPDWNSKSPSYGPRKTVF
jgi:signal transduction histidine kinase